MAAVFDNSVPTRSMEDAGDDVWGSIARCYAAFRSPFVPCREDMEAFEKAVAMQAGACKDECLRALILGVTPGIALMKWPRRSRIAGAEMSSAVIDALWPGDIPGVREAICASWFALPIDRKSCHVVIGDGSLNTCRFPGEVRALMHSIDKVLADSGLLVLRCYIRPDIQEGIDAVFDALFSAEGLTVDCFKMRLYLAMQRSTEEGVSVADAARVLDKYNVDGHVMRERARLGLCGNRTICELANISSYLFLPVAERSA